MLINRTTGSASVVPELVYVDVEQAVDWLCAAFGCTELWRAGGHRARIAFGNGVLIVADADPDYGRAAPKRAFIWLRPRWPPVTSTLRHATPMSPG
jgi:uncharacterized glyoxalase superfamily protein PhnB